MKLDERVAAAMQHVDFVFPQRSASASAGHLCNSSWYGQFEMLQVTGLVRLESNPELVHAALAAEADERKAKLANERAEREKSAKKAAAAQKKAEEAQKKAEEAKAAFSSAKQDDDSSAPPEAKKAKTTCTLA